MKMKVSSSLAQLSNEGLTRTGKIGTLYLVRSSKDKPRGQHNPSFPCCRHPSPFAAAIFSFRNNFSLRQSRTLWRSLTWREPTHPNSVKKLETS